MFKKLTDFSLRRTPLQAFGFYLAWLIAILLTAGIISGIAAYALGLTSSGMSFSSGYDLGTEIGLTVGPWISMLLCTSIAILVVRAKGSLAEFGSLLLILITVGVSFFAGSIFGLIIPAYLTTRTPEAGK